MKRRYTIAAILAALASPLMARAADAPANTTKLEFSTSAQAFGTPTHLTIRLSAHATNESASQAQTVLNHEIATAVKTASGHDGIAVRTGAYNMDQETREHAATRWNASQDLTLDGTDSVTALQIAGELQKQGLTLDGLDWSLDPKLRETLLQKAREEALQKVTREARANAEALGLHFAGLESVSVNAMEPGPRPAMLMAAPRAARFEPPQSAPDDQALRVSVFVTARLTP